jgi:uncharacterized membrane protein YraQ (UPF0718 family)
MHSFVSTFITNLPNQLQNLVTLVLAICIEAFPFIVLGVFFSTIIEVWVPDGFVQKYLPKNRILSHFLTAALGFFMPVCECGNVPVVRKMMQKGFSVSQSITFLLAAPIVNPIVWITTAQAFNLDPNIAIIRILWGLFISVFLGLLFSFSKNQEAWLNPDFAKTCEIGHSDDHDYADHHNDHDHSSSLDSKSSKSKWIKQLASAQEIFQAEIWQTMQMLLVGAVLAGLVQVFVPRQEIITIGQNPILSVFAMLVLAFVVSMCSNVDAFFALSLSGSFNIGSLMTFMVFGPMIDIKILAMLRQTFTPRFLLQLVALVAILSLIAGFGTNLIYYKPVF